MQGVTIYIINGVLLLGACLLCISFFPIQRLVGQLPEGALRKRWNDLRALILFFIMGYVCFTFLYWMEYDNAFNLVVPAVFFLGAVLILFVGTLALQTAIEIKRTSALQYESVTDHLIGIHNRRYLDRRMDEEISRARRYGMQLSLLLLDIDHFKIVNDNYGHQIGDRVLMSLGQLLFREVRDTDIVARFGGEEIAVLAPHTSVGRAIELAERLRRSVEKAIMVQANEYEKRKEITITVSIGVAGLDKKDMDHQAFVHRADKALYGAKKQGRNRVVNFDSLTDSR
ncbi:MAG: GGDEF domain-containing protein [Syntrophales bacterium]